MGQASVVIYEEELREMGHIIARLVAESGAKSAFLIDKDGQLITSSGETEGIDQTSLASLAAGNIAATGGLAELIGEREFSILFHEGEKDHIHISLVGQRAILVVIFDDRTSLGLVRLRVRQAGERLKDCMQRMVERSERGRAQKGLFEEITDEDIDNLFGQ